MKKRTALVAIFAVLGASQQASATRFVNLGGPATGFVAISNFKNSGTQNGIEGLDTAGDPNPNHNGLPDYPNYQMASGSFTAVIASPQSATSDYSAFAAFGSGTFNGDPIAINNQVISQPDFSTLSAGRIDYDNNAVTGNGTEVVPVAGLSFNFNSFEWDGVVDAEPRSNFMLPNAPVFISPFSPVYTEFNDGSGAGNAQLYYEISIDNVSGSGLTFQDGELVSMDLSGDVTVDAIVAPFAGFGSLTYTGTFVASGLDYAFDVSGTDTLAFFSDTNLLMNRAGSASLVPEPSGFLLAIAGGVLVLRRR